jgi:N6-adenosine-specific RNA methylase IME4
MATQVKAGDMCEIADAINKQHAAAQETARTALEHARRCGELLIQAKATQAHGGWRRWLAEHTTVSERMGQNYMRLARAWQRLVEANPKRVSDLSLRGALEFVARGERQAAIRDLAHVRADTCTVDTLVGLAESGRRYATVYADPPWPYRNQGTRAATGNHYLGMTVEEIAALPVEPLLLDQAHLHLWTTNAFLFEAKTVMEAWGFEYKSCFVWVKPKLGIGNYWRVSHEFLLLGVRGKCQFREHDQASWCELPRGLHSSKPEPLRTIIERVSPGPYLELFARRPANGWSVWGNEVDRGLLFRDVPEVA